jgi:spore cortex protein
MAGFCQNEIPRKVNAKNGHVSHAHQAFKGVFRLNKNQWMIPLSVMIFALSGCAANKNLAGVKEQSQNLARPIGYYSNEDHPSAGNGLTTDNDGPMTELMDHTLGAEGEIAGDKRRRTLQTRDENGNPPNPTQPLASHDRNFLQRDNRYSTSDVNYHGHLNRRLGNAGVVTDPGFQDSVSAKIRQKVETVKNVRNVRAVAYGNTVIVSVNLINHNKAAETKKAVRNAVKPYADGKAITVLTDEGSFGRDRNFNNDTQRGGPR